MSADAKHPADRVHDAAAYRAKARERGRQTGEVIFREFPEMIFFGYYLWSFQCDLLNEYCNGLLEAAPAKVKIADGDEWQSPDPPPCPVPAESQCLAAPAVPLLSEPRLQQFSI